MIGYRSPEITPKRVDVPLDYSKWLLINSFKTLILFIPNDDAKELGYV